MTRAERARKILSRLRRLYPEAHCELRHSNPLELLVGTILSAQCTDVRVNTLTRGLFRRYRSAAEYAAADPAQLEAMIRPAGFFRMKARAIREAAAAIVERHASQVPRTMEELLALRGVARKTANVVLGTAFGAAEGVVVDTHVKRLAYRLGLSSEADPVKVERDLMACVPRKDWVFLGHAVIWHGRRVCKAAKPLCGSCSLADVCPRRGVRRAAKGPTIV